MRVMDVLCLICAGVLSITGHWLTLAEVPPPPAEVLESVDPSTEPLAPEPPTLDAEITPLTEEQFDRLQQRLRGDCPCRNCQCADCKCSERGACEGCECPGCVKPPTSAGDAAESTPPPPADPAAAPDTDAPGETPDVGRSCCWMWANQYGGTAVHVGGGTYLFAKHTTADVPPGWTLRIGDQQTGAQIQYSQYDVALARTGVEADETAVVSADPVHEGQRVYLYGMATGATQSGIVADDGSNDPHRAALVEIDAECPGIDLGDSGGGVFDTDGRLVGIISAFYGTKRAGTADQHRAYVVPLHYVAALVAPFTPAAEPADQPGDAPGAESQPLGYAVEVSGGVARWKDSTGMGWHDQGTGLHEGWTYGGRFTYRNGRMFDAAPTSGAVPTTKADVLNNPDQPGDRVIYFGASWCGPCERTVKPVILPALDRAGIAVEEFDADADRGILQAFGVQSLPTFLVVDDWQVTRTITGAGDGTLDELMKALDQ